MHVDIQIINLRILKFRCALAYHTKTQIQNYKNIKGLV